MADIATIDDVRSIVREEIRAALRDLAPSSLETLSTEQAAEIARVTPKTIREWIAEGKLPGKRRGQKHTVQRADLARYMAGERVAATPGLALVDSLTKRSG